MLNWGNRTVTETISHKTILVRIKSIIFADATTGSPLNGIKLCYPVRTFLYEKDLSFHNFSNIFCSRQQKTEKICLWLLLYKEYLHKHPIYDLIYWMFNYITEDEKRATEVFFLFSRFFNIFLCWWDGNITPYFSDEVNCKWVSINQIYKFNTRENWMEK